MKFTKEDEQKYNNANVCWICEEGFLEKIDEKNKGKIKVRDYCHFSGEFRGAAHCECNLKLKEKKFIPILFHNLKGSDSHIFIKAFYDLEEEPNCITQNTEKFIFFSLLKRHSFELRFLNSYGFMAFLLAKLVANLKEFPVMSKFFKKEDVEILRRKGVTSNAKYIF